MVEYAHALGKSLGEFKKGRDEGEKLAADATKDLIEEVKADPAKVVEAKVESKDVAAK